VRPQQTGIDELGTVTTEINAALFLTSDVAAPEVEEPGTDDEFDLLEFGADRPPRRRSDALGITAGGSGPSWAAWWPEERASGSGAG
jgi:hypothetical protein